MENNQKLSVLEKTSYGVGDLACNLFWGLICMATVFYTDYFGLDAGVAGTMILIVSCLDIAFAGSFEPECYRCISANTSPPDRRGSEW